MNQSKDCITKDKGELVKEVRNRKNVCGSMIIYSSPVVNVNIFYTIYKIKKN